MELLHMTGDAVSSITVGLIMVCSHSQLQNLKFLSNAPMSDHHPLEGQFLFPTHQLYGEGLSEQGTRPSRDVPIPKFIPEKRQEYGAALDQKLLGFHYEVVNAW